MRQIFQLNHRFDKKIKKDIQKLCQLDNWHGPLAVASDYAVIAATILLTIHSDWLFYPFALLIIGSRQRALATILHEASHRTLTKSPRLSFLIGSFCSGYLVLSTFSAYKYSHRHLHHGNFGNPEKDCDYHDMIASGVYDESLSRSSYIWRVILAPLLLLRIPSQLYFILKARLFAAKRRKSNLYELILFVFFWGLIVSGFLHFHGFFYLFIFWVVPYLTAFQVINWFIELSEHAPLMNNEVDILMTRNRNSHWFEAFFTSIHNEHYHLAHHLWPCVPFWKMKPLHDILMTDPVYAKAHSDSGGIFLSSNNRATVIDILCSTDRSFLGGAERKISLTKKRCLNEA